MEVLTQTREVMFANSTMMDLVHIGTVTGARSFRTLCLPESTFHGDIAKDIPVKQRRCPRCALKAKEMANAANNLGG